MIEWLSDIRTLALLVLIGGDWVSGVLAALRSGTFTARRIGAVFAADVVPFLLGWGVWYTVVGTAISARWGDPLAASVVWAGALIAGAHLLASIGSNLQELGGKA